MSTADLREIGAVSLLDVDIIGRFYGRESLPYPFMFTQPSRFSWQHDYDDYATSVPDRFNNAELAAFGECLWAYAKADIRVECHAQHIRADAPGVRVLAYRRDQSGFLAKQRSGEDVIDFYELSPYLLGTAVAESAALQRPGRRPAIIIPEYARAADNPSPDDDITMHPTIDDQPTATVVPRTQVRAYGTVQSHWRPTRQWGLDRAKSFAPWVRINNDGEYLYTPDFAEAKPTTTANLAERIDRLITEDVKALRRSRSG